MDCDKLIRASSEKLVAMLQACSLKCATAESCTGGGIGYAITSVAGSSEVFNGGVISYSNEAKHSLLGVKTETLDKYGAVSSRTAEEMARGAKEALKSDIAVSVTGIAGPGGGTAEKPVGLVWFGLAGADGKTRSEKAIFPGDREAVRKATILHALGMLSAAI